MTYPPTIEKLIKLFSRFPTVGPRTAQRFVFYLIKIPLDEFEKLIATLKEMRQKIKICQFCFKPFEESETQTKEKGLCEICKDPRRDKTLLCIVEKETDLMAIENTKKYKGLYFILGRTLSNLKKEDLESFPLKELQQRIKEPKKFGIDTEFQEIIIATNPTTEGETTRLYLERNLKFPNKKITRLGRGLQTGGELEYADEETLSSAFESRR